MGGRILDPCVALLQLCLPFRFAARQFFGRTPRPWRSTKDEGKCVFQYAWFRARPHEDRANNRITISLSRNRVKVKRCSSLLWLAALRTLLFNELVTIVLRFFLCAHHAQRGQALEQIRNLRLLAALTQSLNQMIERRLVLGVDGESLATL